jgi:broad specificity phosphatase PhoE
MHPHVPTVHITKRFTAAALLLIVVSRAVAAQDAIFLVRHAERQNQSSDSPLSPAGRERAKRLAAILKETGVTKIFTTDLQRTIQTAAPLGAALHITPAALPAADVDGLFARLRSSAPADRVLVVGHSNTLPELLQKLGVPTTVTIADTEFDNLFVVVPRTGSTPSLVRLKY